MRAQNGAIPLLAGHMARLTGSGGPDSRTVEYIESAASTIARRTAGWPRGARVRLRYGELQGEMAWDFTVVPLEPVSPWAHGVALSLCETRVTADASRSPFSPSVAGDTAESSRGLARGPLIGCKLLHRDLYRLAERELGECSVELRSELFHEGLLLDNRGLVIEGLRSNLLLWRDGRWQTPSLRNCGVRGVMLNWLAGRVEISEDDLLISDIEQAAEVAVCNAVRGVVPVVQVALEAAWSSGGQVRTLGSGPATRRIQAVIADDLWQ